jgi:16S rRNA (cytosine1402-N4)-methyltransferase
MDTRSGMTAAQLLEQYSYEDLQKVFRQYGELKNAARVASIIIRARESGPLKNTGQLEQALAPLIPKQLPHKFMAKVYQSIRIEVNREMEALQDMLPQTLDYLRPGGRLVIITYHSIEDRIVKNFLRSGNLSGSIDKDFYGNITTPWKLVNRNVIVPGEEEIRENNRARSAKLRIAEKRDG